MSNLFNALPQGEIIASVQYVNPENIYPEGLKLAKEFNERLFDISSGLDIHRQESAIQQTVLLHSAIAKSIISTAFEAFGHEAVTHTDVADGYMELIFADPPVDKEKAQAIGEVIGNQFAKVRSEFPDDADSMPTLFLPVAQAS